MPIGFGKALEIRQDPNANRGKWVEPVIENIKHAAQHPVEAAEQGALGEATHSSEGLMNLLFGLGGVGAMKVTSIPKAGGAAFSSEALPAAEAATAEAAPAATGLTGMVQKFEQQFGTPVKQWNRAQMLEFKAAKDLESGATERALAKQNPKSSSKVFKSAPEEEMTPIGEDVPPDPQKMKSPGLAKMRATKPPAITAKGEEVPQAPQSEVEAMARIEAEPRNVIAEALGGTKPAPRRAPPKPKVPKAVQAPIDTTKGPTMEGMPSMGHAQIKDNWVRNEGNVKEEAFQIYEGRTGKARENWTPEDLQAARNLVQEWAELEEYAKQIQKPAQFWNKRDIDGYLSYKRRTSLDELLQPSNKMSSAEAYIGKPASEWTGADQLRWTKHQLESE